MHTHFATAQCIRIAGMGVAGAGLATAIAEILAVITYVTVMIKKKMVTWKGMLSPPKMETLAPLLAAGASVQLRALVLQIAFVSVTVSAWCNTD